MKNKMLLLMKITIMTVLMSITNNKKLFYREKKNDMLYMMALTS